MFVAAALLTRLGVTWVATTLAPPASLACQVELRPDNAARAWIIAAAAVRDSLRDRGDADRDCRTVVIHAAPSAPSVEVVTLDGRHGVRRLASAGDVAATVAALIVTVRADAPAVDTNGDPDEQVVAVAPPATDSTDVDQPAAGWRPQVVVGGGTRWSLPGTQAAQLELGVGIARPGWELGLFGAWAPTTVALGSKSPVAFASTAEAALGGAWRPALGKSSVDLIVGARAGVIRLANADNNNTGDSTGGNNDVNNVDATFDGVAPAVTGFLGAAFATRSIVHVRPQLWYQWVPRARLGGQNATGQLSSVGLSLGVESRVP